MSINAAFAVFFGRKCKTPGQLCADPVISTFQTSNYRGDEPERRRFVAATSTSDASSLTATP
jgi:hypothetical protein